MAKIKKNVYLAAFAREGACDLGNFISWLKKEENLIIIKRICSEIKTVFQ